MKITPLLLGVSIAANVALLVLVGREFSATPAAGAGEMPASRRPVDAAAQANPELRVANAARASGLSWDRLSAGSPAELVARLRAAGYPPTVIRALLYVRLREQMAARRKELFASIEEPPYWQANRLMMFSPKVAAAQRELQQEQAKLVKELLGPDAVEEDEVSEYYRKRQFGDIPPAKAEELQRITADYSDLRNEIYAATNGMILPEDREKIAFLEKELRSDMAKILTPAELEAYELRSSAAANTLRSQLTTFQPTEDEFRALFRAEQSVEDKFGSGQGMQSFEQMRQRQAAMNEQAKLVLSPERYAEFAQATDPRYMTLNRVVARYGVSPSVVPQVFAVQQEVQQRMRAVPPADRAVQSKVVAQEATARLQTLLGPQAFEAYKLYGGQWLQQLTSPPPPVGPPPAAGSASTATTPPKG